MAAQVQDKEIGSVLIAINSYIHPRTQLEPLPYTDQAFKDYIEAFYRYLFFRVTTLADFTLQEFEIGLEKLVQGSNGIGRIAVVVLGHGGLINGEECVFTNDGNNALSIVKVQERLHKLFPEKSKYLFLDTCRSDGSGNTTSVGPVYKACTPHTTVIYSTLPFNKASSGLWSSLFAKNIMKPMELTNVVSSIDDENGSQASELSTQALRHDPNFRGLAKVENGDRIRELHRNLSEFIEALERVMAPYKSVWMTCMFLFM